jgi:hypothetical protein
MVYNSYNCASCVTHNFRHCNVTDFHFCYVNLCNKLLGSDINNTLFYRNGYYDVRVVKVKFTLEQAMKAQTGSRGIALLFL